MTSQSAAEKRSTGDVVVIGSVNMDLVALTDRHPQVGETVPAKDLKYVPGGKGSNQALAAVRSGAKTTLVARVGDDSFGGQLEQYLADSGIDMTYFHRTPDVLSGLALITLVEGSDNSIVVVPGANALLSPDDITKVPIGPGDVVVTQFEVPLETVRAGLEHAQRVGARSLLNPSPAIECPPEILALPEILVVNETELAWFLGGDGEKSTDDPTLVAAGAKRLRARDEQIIVVTLGGAGSLVLDRDDVHLIPARPTKVVDTTGAGDCFAGSLSSQLARGKTLTESVRYASVAASLCCERLGAGTSSPTRAEVEAEFVG